jgi:DNA-binding MarR family transcriptional regulator
MSKTKPHEMLGRPLPVLAEPGMLELQTWIRLFRVVTRFTRRVERALAARDLSLAQFDVLATLSHGDGITQQELSDRLLVTKGNVCGLIDRAEAAGMVERRTDPEDRRVNRLFLTDRGRQQLACAIPEHRAALHTLMASLPPDELERLHGLLGVLDHAMNRLEPE